MGIGQEEAYMERVFLPCYQTAAAASTLTVDLDEPSLTELLRCFAETTRTGSDGVPIFPEIGKTKETFKQVYHTELQPVTNLLNTFSQPKWWAAVPVTIPFVVAGTVLGGPYALARENGRYN